MTESMTGTEKQEAERLAKEFRDKFKEDRLRFRVLPGITPTWNPGRLVALFKYASDPNPTQEQVAQEIGVDRSAVSRKVRTMDWKGFKVALSRLCTMTKEEAIASEAERNTEKTLVKQEEKGRKLIVDRQSFYQRLLERILEENKETRIRTVPLPPRSRTRGISSPEHVGLLLSDAHAGLGFSAEETGGINSFDNDILARRFEGLQRGIASIYAIHRKAYRLPCLHIFCLGDMVQGGNLNGEWGPAYNKEHLVAQAQISANLVAETIVSVLRLFERVEFLGVVGNHGRAGVTKNSDRVGANWDNIVYILLKAMFKDNKRVDIRCDGDTWWASKNVLGTEFVLIHGDNIAGLGTLSALKALNQKLQDIVSKQTGRGFNVLCLGHYHTFQETETTTGRILVNGSFVGADMHSLQHMQAGGKATQTIFGVHAQHGITWKYNIDLDAERGE